MNQESAHTLYKYLEIIDFTSGSSLENVIASIVAEESEAFFSGGKTAEETAKIIQNHTEQGTDTDSGESVKIKLDKLTQISYDTDKAGGRKGELPPGGIGGKDGTFRDKGQVLYGRRACSDHFRGNPLFQGGSGILAGQVGKAEEPGDTGGAEKSLFVHYKMIIFPVVCLPFFQVLKYNRRQQN